MLVIIIHIMIIIAIIIIIIIRTPTFRPSRARGARAGTRARTLDTERAACGSHISWSTSSARCRVNREQFLGKGSAGPPAPKRATEQ